MYRYSCFFVCHFRILQDFTDKYKANDSPGDPSPLHSPSRNRGNHNGNANRERERDNERDRESESGRDERSGSISSTNSLGSSSTRISHTQDRTGGVGGSSGGGNGGVGTGPSELKSILRRKTVTPTSATQTARANASTSALAEPSSPPLSTIRPTARARSVTPTLYSHLLPLTVPPPPPPGSPSLFNVFNSPQSGQGAVPGSVLTSREQTQNFLLGEVTPEEEEVDLRESQKEKERERERGEMKRFEPSEEIIRCECLFDVSRSAFTAVSLIDIRTTADDNLINFIAEEKKSRLKLIVVASETLPVTLDQFASMFIEVNAPFCMKK